MNRFVAGEHGLAELELLQRILTRCLDLPAQLRERVLRAIGEYGRSAAERLGVTPADRPCLAELERIAREQYEAWDTGQSEVTDRAMLRTVRDTFAELLRHVSEARRHLEEPW